MNIIVTGGAGYIGSHCCKILAQKGYTPIVVDNLSEGHRELVKWGIFEECDLKNGHRLLEIMGKHKPSGVMHFAAHALVGESMKNPFKYYENNIIGLLNVLECMKMSECENIVFSSTCATYGISDEVCVLKEGYDQKPINPYGKSKFMCEEIIRDYGKIYGMNYSLLRYFNAAGADPEGETGEWHDNETHLIPTIFDVITGKNSEIKIFGTDYGTPDGTCVRDYVHVMDIVEAHILCLEKMLLGSFSGAFNLGTGKGLSVKQIIDEAEEMLGCEISKKTEDRRPGDPPMLIADYSKIKMILGWKPAKGIKDILHDAWKWHQIKEKTYNKKAPTST